MGLVKNTDKNTRGLTMDRLELLEAMAAADAAIERAGTVQLGPNGLERIEPNPVVAQPPLKPRWTGRPRRNSKQGRRERGIV